METEAKESNINFTHPLQYEMLHDKQTAAIFELATFLEEASREPYSEEIFNPYHKLLEIIYNYVGDPDPELRKGVHLLPDVTRDTQYSNHTYSLGCAVVFDPESAELCIIRKDPDAPSDKAKDWMVIRYNISNGNLKEEIVQDVVVHSQEDGDNITLDIVSNDGNSGTDRLTLSVDKFYNWDGKPVKYIVDTTYGRRADSSRFTEYTEDISVLYDKLRDELRFREDDLQNHNITETQSHSKDFYQYMGHVADKAA